MTPPSPHLRSHHRCEQSRPRASPSATGHRRPQFQWLAFWPNLQPTGAAAACAGGIPLVRMARGGQPGPRSFGAKAMPEADALGVRTVVARKVFVFTVVPSPPAPPGRPGSGRKRNGFAIVRPPGHHATREAAMGFCFLNNIAMAARYAALPETQGGTWITTLPAAPLQCV